VLYLSGMSKVEAKKNDGINFSRLHNIFKGVLGFLKKNAVLCVAVTAAIITSFIVPPDKEYLNYFDYKTLTCLFCVLAVVCALKNVNFFYVLAQKIVKRFKTVRSAVIALVCITFIGSMLIANDMALLTFLPLGFFVLQTTGKQKHMVYLYYAKYCSQPWRYVNALWQPAKPIPLH